MKVNGLMEQRVVKEDFGMQMAIHMKDFGRVYFIVLNFIFLFIIF